MKPGNWVLPGVLSPFGLLREVDDYGVTVLDLVRPPQRFWGDGGDAPPGQELHLDARRVTRVQTPGELLSASGGRPGEAAGRKALAGLRAWFLISEDPHRRLDANPIVTLAHQVTLVRHVLEEPDLERVLIADEVGLGKTIEAGLIIRELLEKKRGTRVLYLAPARLVANVRREFEVLGLPFRSWVASRERDCSLSDPLVLASIHRASTESGLKDFRDAAPWDVIVVDECHHLSAWEADGGGKVKKYRLVEELAARLSRGGRLLLMSGTPHQGHPDRFKNLLRLLKKPGETDDAIAGRIIYRTKEDVADWDGNPLFPQRRVNRPIVVDLGPEHREWLLAIHRLFDPKNYEDGSGDGRAAGWRRGQALQWATSSIEAGIGFLVRQGVRAGWSLDRRTFREAIAALRPYRGRPADEPVERLFDVICREVGGQAEDSATEDLEDPGFDEETPDHRPATSGLESVLRQGLELLSTSRDEKWQRLFDEVLVGAGDEKVVLFAQPVETVMSLWGFLKRKKGTEPALIVGAQGEERRAREIKAFWQTGGPQFLLASRAGGEGLNLQVARRLVHVDVPWNPMDMEQRVGRVHRFRSRKTILVDTLVVAGSREEDAYAIARSRLEDIAKTLGSEERFESLFARVMSLVPPEQLQGVLGARALGPLDADEQRAVADLVRKGYAAWKRFHELYAESRKLPPSDAGAATWGDVAEFVRRELDASDVAGFSALKFGFRDGEVTETSDVATTLEIQGEAWACGDYGGMPVTGAGGYPIRSLGLNVGIVTERLRELGLTQEAIGAVVLKGRHESVQGTAASAATGVLAFARVSVRVDGGTFTENSSELHVWLVNDDGPVEITGSRKGPFLREVLGMQPTGARAPAPMVEQLERLEAGLGASLMRPSESDREKRIQHAVFPLLAGVVIA